MDKIKKMVGRNLKYARIKADLTQAKLAEKIDMQAQSLSVVEQGKNYMSYETPEKICVALNISPMALYSTYVISHNENDNNVIDDITKTLQICNSQQLKLIHKILYTVVLDK